MSDNALYPTPISGDCTSFPEIPKHRFSRDSGNTETWVFPRCGFPAFRRSGLAEPSTFREFSNHSLSAFRLCRPSGDDLSGFPYMTARSPSPPPAKSRQTAYEVIGKTLCRHRGEAASERGSKRRRPLANHGASVAGQGPSGHPTPVVYPNRSLRA